MSTTVRDILSRELSRGKTLRQLSEEIGDVSHEALRLVANGSRTPSAKMARKICEALKVAPADIEVIVQQIQNIKHGLVSASDSEERTVSRLLNVFFEHAGRERTPELETFLATTYKAILEKEKTNDAL